VETNDTAFWRGYVVRRIPSKATLEEEDEMQRTETNTAESGEKLSLGALIVILTVTNLVVFLTLAPYA
jgi:hypothetical protein